VSESAGLRAACWRVQVRTAVFMGLVWAGGVGLGLGWGVALARHVQRQDTPRPARRAPSAPRPVLLAPRPVQVARAAGVRPIPQGLVVYPRRTESFELPAHLRRSPEAPARERRGHRPLSADEVEAVVTVSRTADRSSAAEAVPEEVAAVAEAAVERAAEPEPEAEPEPAEAPLDPAEVARAAAELAKVRAYHQRTAEIQAMGRRARTSEEWVLRAIMAQELARLKDPRVVEPLGELLEDKKDEVVFFVLLGLAEYGGEDLRRGGGAKLAGALLEAGKRHAKEVREQAFGLLRRISGEDLPSRPRAWKRWLAAHATELDQGLAAPEFDEGAYDPRVVARVRTGGGTRLRADPSRIPGNPVFSKLEELQRRGLDLVVCLDQTSSMEAVIEAAKGNLGVFSAVLDALVERNRLGLVTYKDGVTARLPLGGGAQRFRDALQGVWANGGGDIEEGVDKALASALQRNMGWQKNTTKVVVVVGDAPPHAPDVASMQALAKSMHQKQQVVFHAVDCGGLGADVARLATSSKGSVIRLTASDTLIYQILGVVFGEELRPAVERFLDTYLEWVGKR